MNNNNSNPVAYSNYSFLNNNTDPSFNLTGFNHPAEISFTDFIKSLSQLSAQLDGNSGDFDQEEADALADEKKLKLIQTKNSYEKNFLSNLLNQFAPELRIDKLIEIFQQFTQQDSLIDIWTNYLPGFFAESSDLINNFEDIKKIISACYLQGEDYLLPYLLHSFTLLFTGNRIEQLINNDISNFIWFLKIVHPDDIPEILRIFSIPYIKNLVTQKNNISRLKNEMDNEPDSTGESWNLILLTLHEMIQDNKIFTENIQPFLISLEREPTNDDEDAQFAEAIRLSLQENNNISLSKKQATSPILVSEFSKTWNSQLAKRKYEDVNEKFNKRIKFTENCKSTLFTPVQQINIPPEELYSSFAKIVLDSIYITDGNTIAVKFRERMQTIRQQIFDRIPRKDREGQQQGENIVDKVEESFQLYAAVVNYAMSEMIKQTKQRSCTIMENSNRYGITSIKFFSTSDMHEFAKLLETLIDTVRQKPLNAIKKIINRNNEELRALYHEVTTHTAFYPRFS